MNKIKKIFKDNKYALIWTAGYIAVTWLVLISVFGFNIFSTHHWSFLLHARIRGFAGFAFGIMMLAAVPLYAATTYLIIRTKKPIIALSAKKEEAKQPEKQPAPPPAAPAAPLPAGLPTELKGAFIRARQNVSSRIVSDFEMKDIAAEKQPVAAAGTAAPAGGLPLPDDFGAAAASNAPMFREISFGPSNDDSPAAVSPAAEKSILELHLENAGYDFSSDGDIIIASLGTPGAARLAIATHDDSDFWIADDPTPDGAEAGNWFAAGKQKTSPVAAALAAGEAHNAAPVLYLAQANIMDLDNKISEWESRGVRVIKQISDL